MNRYSVTIRKGPRTSLELPIGLFLIGINKASSTLCELHPSISPIVDRIVRTFFVSIIVLVRNGKKLSVQGTRLNISPTILKDKSKLSDTDILTTVLLKIAIRNVIGKEKVSKPFWNSRCDEMSKKIWLPTETDLPSYSKPITPNSLFLTNHSTNPLAEEFQVTSRHLSKHTRTASPEGSDEIHLRSRKVKIYPSNKQRRILKEWFGTTRYVYNRALASIKSGEDTINFMKLRNKYVTRKNNEIAEEWEFNTPKVVREESLRDLEKAYKTVFSNLRNGNIDKFTMRYKSKRNKQCIVIPKVSIKADASQNKFRIFPRFVSRSVRGCNDKKTMKIVRRGINSDCRLTYNNGDYHLIIPIPKRLPKPQTHDICSLDPGVRKFHTIFSPKSVGEIRLNKDRLGKYHKKLDFLQELRTKKRVARASPGKAVPKGGRVSKSKFRRRYKRQINRMTNLVDDIHWKLIGWLLKNHQVIHLPKFGIKEISKLLKNSRNSTNNREIYLLRHYAFKERLRSSASSEHVINICGEEYTSKTCTRCGTLNNPGCSEVYECSKCKLVIDRDINGARNIFLKQECS